MAQELNQFDLESLPRNFIASYPAAECTNVFLKHYASIERFDHGQVASVYKVQSRDGRTYLMKAFPLDWRKPGFRLYSMLLGASVLDEVRIAKALTQLSEELGVAGWFMRSVDWFQCNERAIVNAFHSESKPNRWHKINTQFLIMEEVAGKSVYRTLNQLTDSRALTVDFIRSALFQTLFALELAEERVQFSHFDAHARNILMSKPVDADICRAEQQRFEEGRDPALQSDDATRFWQFDLHGTSTGQADNSLSYYVPVKDSCGARFVFIDFGTGVITHDLIESKRKEHTQKGKQDSSGRRTLFGKTKGVIGPAYFSRFSRLSRETFNMRQVVFTLMVLIPRWFYDEWKRTDNTSYRQFNALFYKVAGLDQFRSWQTWFKVTGKLFGHREVRDFGSKWSLAAARNVAWYDSIIRLLGLSTFMSPTLSQTAVSYHEVLRMPFFRDAYTRRLDDDVEQVNGVKFVAAVNAENKGERFLREFQQRVAKRKARNTYYARQVEAYGQ